MVTRNQVEEQLKRVGCNFRWWGRAEIRELANILRPEETIAQAVNGHYEGGFAMLCVTDHRLLLIDRKPMFFTLEDIRFDMISEIDFSARLMDGTIHVITPTHKLIFTAWNQVRLRRVMEYTQEKIMEIRQHFMMQHLQAAQGYAQATNAPFVGGLAMQGNAAANAQFGLPMNPYTKMPLLTRRRRYPKFYS
ncbi:MAG TPA: PH domain-containing protein [Candidatus Saccharimonadales bacterium]|nr:PH domain-containing protein [Candidatus Saccharimonadales bacterium]